MLANRARKAPVHFPHMRRTKRPTSMRMSRLILSQNGAFGPEIVQFFRAKIREVIAFFLRHRRRNALKRRPQSLQKLN